MCGRVTWVGGRRNNLFAPGFGLQSLRLLSLVALPALLLQLWAGVLQRKRENMNFNLNVRDYQRVSLTDWLPVLFHLKVQCVKFGFMYDFYIGKSPTFC